MIRRVCKRRSRPAPDHAEHDHGEVTEAALLVTGRDAAELPESVDQMLNPVALPAGVAVEAGLPALVTLAVNRSNALPTGGWRSAHCSDALRSCGPTSRSVSAKSWAGPRRTTWRSSRRQAAAACCPRVATWAYHAHDTYGLGLAAIHAAYREGVMVFGAAGSLGGCPFVPGATGNVATEDVARMFEPMRIDSGIDPGAQLPVAQDAAALPGASACGRARKALRGGTICAVAGA